MPILRRVNRTANLFIFLTERVKLLLQVQWVHTDIPPERRYKGVADCARRVYTEQVRGEQQHASHDETLSVVLVAHLAMVMYPRFHTNNSLSVFETLR